MEPNNDSQIKELLHTISKLLAAIAVKGLSQREQIALLSRAGFAPKDIAQLLGTTANAVRVALVSIRREAPRGRRTVIREENLSGQ